MKTSELAKACGVTIDTVRYYTRIGILKPRKRQSNGYNDYDDQDSRRLRFSATARQIGFSVADIQGILATHDAEEVPCKQVREVMASRLKETQKQFEAVKTLRDRMTDVLDRWKNLPDQQIPHDDICYLVSDWSKEHHDEQEQ